MTCPPHDLDAESYVTHDPDCSSITWHLCCARCRQIWHRTRSVPIGDDCEGAADADVTWAVELFPNDRPVLVALLMLGIIKLGRIADGTE